MPDLQKKRRKKENVPCSFENNATLDIWTRVPTNLHTLTHNVGCFHFFYTHEFCFFCGCCCCLLYFSFFTGVYVERGWVCTRSTIRNETTATNLQQVFFHTDAFLSVSCDVNSSLNLSFLGVWEKHWLLCLWWWLDKPEYFLLLDREIKTVVPTVFNGVLNLHTLFPALPGSLNTHRAILN